MSNGLLTGVAIVAFAGFVTSASGWPIKIMRKYKFEHWFFLSCMMSLMVMPWLVTLIGCPNAFDAYREVWRTDPGVFIKSNIFSLCWGVANVLCGLCLVRIGFALTGGILTGLGVSLGVVIPMILKGTGKFQDAPGVGSPAGLAVLSGVAVMLIGVVLVSCAGFAKDRYLKKTEQKPGGNLERPVNFATGLIMVVVAGVLSCGITFAFVYSQGPIVAAMQARGASEFAASYAVWAVGLTAGALVNILYPVYLMTRNKSWGVLRQSPLEFFLSIFMGSQGVLAIPLMGVGMLKLGPLGASVGFGIQQAAMMIGNQTVGFVGGEWKGVQGKPRLLMYSAIVCLLIAAAIMAYGNALTKA